MEIEGKIIQYLGEQSGTSKAGNLWKKKEWVLETFGQYPRKVKFHIFGDRSDTIVLEPGKDYILSFDLESREFNGRWYTDVSVYGARENTGQTQTMGQPQGFPNNPNYQASQQFQGQQGGNMQFGGPQSSGYQVNPETFNPSAGDGDEDLPF